MSETDVIKGVIKVQNLIEEVCITDFTDFIRQIPNFLSVEVPATISNVVIGTQQPGSDKRNNLWIRLDASGDFVGIYVYAVGQWRQIYPVPNGLIWIADSTANSSIPIPGYIVAFDSATLTTSQKNWLKTQSHHINDIPTNPFDIYPVFFVGY